MRSMQSFDAVNGGFGGAPKFPHPSSLDALLRHARLAAMRLRAMPCLLTARASMAEGGIYDHLGGGFCRYSTDAELDHSPLREDAVRQRAAARACMRKAGSSAATPLFRQVCEETAAWLMREMQSQRGRLLFQPRCRLRGRRRSVLRLAARRGRAASRRGRIRRIRSALRARRGAELRGPRMALARRSAVGRCRPSGSARTPAECGALISGARARLFALRDTRAHGPAATTRC